MLYDDQDNADADDNEVFEVLRPEDYDQPTSLSESIKVVIKDLNNNFLENCLINILINFVNKNTNPLLRDKFFPELKIQELTDLHRNLREDLKFVEVDFKKIGEVFNKYEKDFLIYCPVIAKLRTLSEFLKDKMTHDKSLKRNLLELIQRIPQALMRYPMALEDVAIQAIKSEQPLVEREAKKAHEIIKRVVKHIDTYSSDYKNIELVESMQKEMDCKQLKGYGLLLHEVEDVGILYRRHDERPQILPKHKLLVFEEAFAAFERKEIQKVQKYKDGTIKMSAWGEPVMKTSTKYYLSRTFGIARFSEINPIRGNNKVLALNTYLDGAKLDKERSLEIEFNTEEGRKTFIEMLKERQTAISNFENPNPGSYHQGHVFSKFQNAIVYTNQVHHVLLPCVP